MGTLETIEVCRLLKEQGYKSASTLFQGSPEQLPAQWQKLYEAAIANDVEVKISWVHSVDLEKDKGWDVIKNADAILVPGEGRTAQDGA